jgi:hypothetical protein
VAADGVWVDIESGRIRYVAPGVIRYDGDVIAYLLIVRKTRLRIERIAHRNVRRPGDATICAPGIE